MVYLPDELCEGISSVDIVGNIAYVTTQGIQLLNVSDPASPSYIGEIRDGYGTSHATANANGIVAVNGWDLRVWTPHCPDATPIDPHEVPDVEPAPLPFVYAHPNPFSSSARVVVELEQSMDVTVDVFDVAGRLVASRELGMRPKGRHHVDVQASELPGTSAIWFVRTRTRSRTGDDTGERLGDRFGEPVKIVRVE